MVTQQAAGAFCLLVALGTFGAVLNGGLAGFGTLSFWLLILMTAAFGYVGGKLING